MRSGWEGDAHHLIFDVGPLGCPISAGHGHADLLSIQCSAFGEPTLVDPGTYCYTSDLEWRHFFRGSAAHSTVVVDGQSQAVAAGPFSWEERPRARLRLWLSTDTYDFADAEHDAYHRLSDPVTHRRRLAFIKPRYWVVVDDLEGAAGHRVEIRFQFASIAVSVDSKLWAWARGKEGRGLLIKPFATVPLEVALHEGELAPIQGWVAPDYGQRRPAPTLVYSTISRLPLRILTLILPAENPAAPPSVLALLSDRVGPVGLHFPGDSESLIFWEDSIVFQRS